MSDEIPPESTSESTGEVAELQYHCDDCGNDFTHTARVIQDVDPATGEPGPDDHPGQGLTSEEVTCPNCGSDNVKSG